MQDAVCVAVLGVTWQCVAWHGDTWSKVVVHGVTCHGVA